MIDKPRSKEEVTRIINSCLNATVNVIEFAVRYSNYACNGYSYECFCEIVTNGKKDYKFLVLDSSGIIG